VEEKEIRRFSEHGTIQALTDMLNIVVNIEVHVLVSEAGAWAFCVR
jgi:hypothetical protein